MRPSLRVVVLVTLLLAALGACASAPRSRAEGMEAMRKQQIDYFTEQLEKNPDDLSALDQRSQKLRDGGDEASLRKAVVDLDRAIRLAPKEKLADFYNARASTKGEIYKLTRREADKKSCLDDLAALIAKDPQSVFYLSRAKVLNSFLDEPFLAEEDALEAIRRAGFEEKYAWKEVAHYETLTAIYGSILKRVKGRPEEAGYDKLFVRALDDLTVAKRNKRNHDEAWQRERMRANAAMLAEEVKREAARGEAREKAEVEYRAAQKKLWANRTECKACGGRGFQSAGGGSEHRIDWIESSRGSIMRSTTKTTPPTVLTCPVCWGKGYTEPD